MTANSALRNGAFVIPTLLSAEGRCRDRRTEGFGA